MFFLLLLLSLIISHYYAAIFIVSILIRETDDFHMNCKKLSIDRKSFIDIIKTGFPNGIQGVKFSISNVQIQSAINSFGTVMIAGNASAVSLENFLYRTMGGFTTSNLTFCAQNTGANKMDRIKKSVTVSALFTAVTGITLGFLFILSGKQLLHIYTTDSAVIEAGLKRMYVINTTIWLCRLIHSFGNSICGTGHSLTPAITVTAGCSVLSVLWLAILFPVYNTPFNVFVSYPISWGVTALTNLIFFLILYERN